MTDKRVSDIVDEAAREAPRLAQLVAKLAEQVNRLRCRVSELEKALGYPDD